MATARKVLGQQNPAANTQTTLYTVPASTDAVVSSIVIAELGGAASTFCLRIKVGGAADANKQLFAKNVAIAANEILTLTLGITLAATDVLQCSATTADVSFQAFGQETT